MRRGKTGQEKRIDTGGKAATGGDRHGLTDYGSYRFLGRELAMLVLTYNMVFLLIARLFYDCLPAAVFGNLAVPFLLSREAAKRAKKRQDAIRLAFREFILSFGNSLRAGYSIENAFVSAYEDIRFLYGEEEDFLAECRWMIGQMENNRNLEDVFAEFADRTHVKDIQDFAYAFRTAKKSGGNLSKMIQDTAGLIGDKISVREEISLLIAAKRMEQNVMNLVPPGIMLYISVTSKGYFDVLYHNVTGIAVMTGCLILYLFCYFLSGRIIAIEIQE